MNGWVYDTDAKSPTLTTNKGEGSKIALRQSEARLMVKEFEIKNGGVGNRVYSLEGKSPSLMAQSGGTAGIGSALITGARIVGRKLNPDTGKRDDYNSELEAEQRLELREDGKAGCITSVQKDSVLSDGIPYRKLTPIECERLQGLPDNYTNHVSNTQRYKALGNGWQVDTIVHIFQEMQA